MKTATLIAIVLGALVTATPAQFANPFPGTGEDLEFTSRVNGAGIPTAPIKSAYGGDLLALDFLSPGDAFVGLPSSLIFQVHATGFPPVSGLDGVHIDLNATPGPEALIIDVPMPPGGFRLAGIVPPVFAGISAIVQGFALGTTAANGLYASTNAHEIRFGVDIPPFVVRTEPPSPLPGTLVTIHGAGFEPGLALSVEGVPTPVVDLDFAEVVFTMPSGLPCDAQVVLTNANGLSDVGLINRRPRIDFYSPTAVNGNSGGFNGLLIVVGDHFDEGLTLTLAGVPTPIVGLDRSVLFTGIPPIPPTAPPGLHLMSRTGCIEDVPFQVIVPAPVINSLAPVSGPHAGGAPVFIIGTDFTPGFTSVTIGGTPAFLAVDSPNLLLALTPPGSPGATVLTVTTPGGSASAPYTYFLPPTISAVVPDTGPVAGGAPISITGTDFVRGFTTAAIGSLAIALSAESPTTLVGVTPPGVPGPKTLTVTTPGGTATTTYTYQ